MKILLFTLLMFHFSNTPKPLNEKSSTKELLYPLSESFENDVPRWRGVNKSGTYPNDTVQVYPLGLESYDGYRVMRFGSANTDSASEWLITPPLRVTDSSDTFVFYYRVEDNNFSETFQIRIADSIATNGVTDTAEFTIEHSPITVSNTSWARYWMTLKNYVGKDIQIAIHYMSDHKRYLYVDYFNGPLVDTIPPQIRLVYPHSHFREPERARDTVKFLIQDTSGVRKAAIQDWGYKHPWESQWTDEGYMDLIRKKDTFYAVIPIQDSLQIYFYVQAEDSAGNPINYRFFEYNILPTRDWLIVYYYKKDADRIASYFDLKENTITFPDTVRWFRFDDLPHYLIDSLYQGIIWSNYKFTYSNDTVLINFLRHDINTDKRKRFILFSDDAAYFEHDAGRDSLFLNRYLRTRYIADDWSSGTDHDTLEWRGKDDTFTIYSLYPDLLFPFSPDSYLVTDRDTYWAYMGDADVFLYVINSDSSVKNYGGFIVNEISYLAHYVPFRPQDVENEVDFDTLMDRILYDSLYNQEPVTIDSGRLVRPDSTVALPDSLTVPIIGFATASGDCEQYPRSCIKTIVAQVGWGPDGSFPWDTGWHWFDADTFYHTVDTIGSIAYVRDSFAGKMVAPPARGHYDYCYRFAILGQPWVYADLNGTNEKGGEKLAAHHYEPEEAGDLKVTYAFDVAASHIDTIIGKHWVGDTDSIFVVFKNEGYYAAKYDVFLQLNGRIQDSSMSHELPCNDVEKIKLRFVHEKENGDTITVYSKWIEDQNVHDDSITTIQDAKPYGLYLVENFDSWIPPGWSIDNDVTNGWEQGDGNAYGDPSEIFGPFARFDTWYTYANQYEYLVSPEIEVWNIGNLRMRFYYINEDGNDSLVAMHRVNNGSWIKDLILHTSSSWTPQQIIYRDLSKKKDVIDTLQIRFYAVSDYGYTNIGIDSVMVFDATQLGKSEAKEKPLSLKLYRIYPQPAVNELTIKFDIPQKQKVELNIYDIQGRLISTLVSGVLNRGTYIYRWRGRNTKGQKVSCGVYIIKLKTNSKTLTDRVIYLRR